MNLVSGSYMQFNARYCIYRIRSGFTHAQHEQVKLSNWNISRF